MLERFLKQSTFTSMEDFKQNLEFIVPENFNFAYDVVDAWAEEAPNKLALLWTNDKEEERRLTFKQLKEESDKVARPQHWKGRHGDAHSEAQTRILDQHHCTP